MVGGKPAGSTASEAKPGPCPCSWTSIPLVRRRRSYGLLAKVRRSSAAGTTSVVTGGAAARGGSEVTVMVWSCFTRVVSAQCVPALRRGKSGL